MKSRQLISQLSTFLLIFIFNHYSYSFKQKKCRFHNPRIFPKPLVIGLNSNTHAEFIDISPEKDGGVLKKIMRRGNPEFGVPKERDVVELQWTMMRDDGSFIHSSEKLSNETFFHVVGILPCDIIKGWALGIPTMHQGELARYIISPAFAFGDQGALPFVQPNECITCDIELLNIIPDFTRKYDVIGPDDDIKEDLMEKIESGESPISEHVLKNKIISEHKSSSGPGKDPLVFDPSIHSIDPNEKVSGIAEAYKWTETTQTIDLVIKLRDGIVKDDIIVDIRLIKNLFLICYNHFKNEIIVMLRPGKNIYM